MFAVKKVDFKGKSKDFATLFSSEYRNDCVFYLENKGFVFQTNKAIFGNGKSDEKVENSGKMENITQNGNSNGNFGGFYTYSQQLDGKIKTDYAIIVEIMEKS